MTYSITLDISSELTIDSIKNLALSYNIQPQLITPSGPASLPIFEFKTNKLQDLKIFIQNEYDPDFDFSKINTI
jgi:hypothetical protein